MGVEELSYHAGHLLLLQMSKIEEQHEQEVEDCRPWDMQLHQRIEDEPELVNQVLSVLDLSLDHWRELEAVLDLVEQLEVAEVLDEVSFFIGISIARQKNTLNRILLVGEKTKRQRKGCRNLSEF